LIRSRIPRLELAVQKHSRLAAIAALAAWRIIEKFEDVEVHVQIDV
jgi:hypothetical protein